MINLVNTGQCFRTPEPDWYDTETDWAAVERELLQFPELANAIKAAPGMQILRQPFVECVISYIVSANNNIKRFTKTLAHMKFDLEWLSKQTEYDFKKIGCGYRAAYLVRASRQLLNMEYGKLNMMSDDDLYKQLRTIAGVGDKVARCVMLFCFHRLHIVPVDTWIARVHAQVTGERGERNPKKMAEELQRRWGRYAGVAQQYIFHFLQHKREQLLIAKA